MPSSVPLLGLSSEILVFIKQTRQAGGCVWSKRYQESLSEGLRVAVQGQMEASLLYPDSLLTGHKCDRATLDPLFGIITLERTSGERRYLG